MSLAELQSFIWPLALFWFLIYWIGGGVLFSILALFRSSKLRKTRFSCLFTLLAAGCGYGAAHLGMRMGEKQIDACLVEATGLLEAFAAMIGCGIFQMMFSGIAFGIVLFVFGLFFMLISRSKKQSWVY